MNAWRSTYASFVAVPALDGWIDAQRAKLADDFFATYTPDPRDWKGTKRANALAKAVAVLNSWEIRADSCRALRAIVAAQRARLDARTDRLLAKRTDALGDLYRLAAKKPV